MSDDCFDDGLVHSHAWHPPAHASADRSAGACAQADVSRASTPSTVFHDDMMFAD